ncbi:TetR/AcrR family transcriptional regulator [Plantactinospora siamensis]|uniref:TetR/AcrR family transcriptional regulator n=1 Tax=Plantactinospora siamensis TaxID=555372 RepID=A0ABV6NVH1_9ACTN
MALRLAVERGPGSVRIEDIAAAADVALRTFHNHFASKEEAIMLVAVERAEAVGAGLSRRPPRESLPDALVAAFVEQYGFDGALDESWLRQVRLAMSAPALRGEYLKAFEAGETSLATALADRMGTGPGDLLPRTVAAAAFGAARAAIAYWLDHGPVTGLPALFNDAIRSVVHPQPEGKP